MGNIDLRLWQGMGRVIQALFLAAVMAVTGYSLPPTWTTADGSHLYAGEAACPAQFPFGTVLDIEGIGAVACHDRTPGNPWLIDVWEPSKADCYAITGRYWMRWAA